MDGHKSKPASSVKVTSQGKVYEPFGPKIMVTHPARAWCPPTDVFECADLYIIKCAISGLHCDENGHIENTRIAVKGNTISISGHRHDSCVVPRCAVFQMDIHYGAFECTVEIQDPFDAAAVRAQYEDGFLKVFVPKKKSQYHI